jgi:hypothetical protein
MAIKHQTALQLAAKSPDSYEIAFTELVAEGALTKDEGFVAPSVKAEIENLSGAEASRRYRRDPEFRKQFDLVASKEAATRFSDSDPYRHLSAESYRSIDPITRASLYARNAFFQAAVQRLISEGVI